MPTVSLSVEDIGKIIQNLGSNKAHDLDNINFHMLKICTDPIYKLLKIMFRQALVTGVFPSLWNKGNIVPVQSK